MVSLAIWLIVIAPVQYLVFVVTGAPARQAIRTKTTPIARIGRRTEVQPYPESRGVPQGWTDANLFRRPVTSAALLATGVLAGVRALI
jgi:hypothetical protein